MKISASIYANSSLPLAERIALLERASVDMLHIDCTDNPAVFADIDFLAQHTALPVDFHLISSDTDFYLSKIAERKIKYCSLQLECLRHIPDVLSYPATDFGIAVKTATPLDFLDEIIEKGYKYVMLMCTTPGKSGGVFEKINFQRIHAIKEKFPNLKIQIDGGVDSEIVFILRLLGVDSFVSGSYLMSGNSVSEQMLTFFKPAASHHFTISDFMLPLSMLPVLQEKEYSFYAVLEKIEQHKQGFVLITTADGQLSGVVANADCRRAILCHRKEPDAIELNQVLNRKAIKVNADNTVYEMWKTIQELSFIILFLPVVNNRNELVGAVLLNNLTRG